MEISDIKRLSYLNLEYSTGKERRTIDDVPIFCFSSGPLKHKFHSENTHLNTLSDICYLTAFNLECLYSSVTPLLLQLLENQKIQKQCFDSFETKLEYLQSNLSQITLRKNKKFDLLLEKLQQVSQKLTDLEKVILS